MTLGPGTNIINASNIVICAQKNTYTITASNQLGSGLRIRGLTGADSDGNVNITLGNKNVSGGTGTITGSMLLNGCNVNIKANLIAVGESIGGQPSSAADDGNGILAFDTGTISANTVIMADNTSANTELVRPSAVAPLLSVPTARFSLARGSFSIWPVQPIQVRPRAL